MKRTALAILVLLLSARGWGLEPIADEEIALLHWMPQTAEQALLRSRALELWLGEQPEDLVDWRRQVDLRVLNLERESTRWQPLLATPIDGLLGWLVQVSNQNLTAPATAEWARETLLTTVASSSPANPVPAQTRLTAQSTWSQLRARLLADGVPDVEMAIAAYWAGLRSLASAGDAADRRHAGEQALRARASRDLPAEERLSAMAVMARAESEAAWRRGDDLSALWFLLEALVRTLPLQAPADGNAQLAPLIQTMIDAGETRQRGVDEAFPVLLAQLQDAAEYLAGQPPARDLAAPELLDAYFRLALFVPDAAFYLNQPVREHLSEALMECQVNPDLVGPLPRQIFEQCPDRIFALMQAGLNSDELVGGAEGPFAPEFLRREMSLVSWQRARYLDGHLNWELQSSCQAPDWVNPLEWSILVHYLSTWVPQRPVFFGTARWQEAVEDLLEMAAFRAEAQVAWLDCISGHGGLRRDPVSRLIRVQSRALNELDAALQSAYRVYLADQTRPGSDVDLSAGVDQVTAYRPEGLSVLPCSGGQTCGARVELPVSRALLGLFPNTYLLADQLGMGRLGLCYDAVHWVDREARSARPQDPQVANYFGRLSFELVGTFDDGSGAETVFRHRLTSTERSHYLFAEASDELLELECPLSLSGRSVASQLPPERRGLVPHRLTYFVSTPVTADAKLAANWDRGAEWRDWFFTGNQVEVVESPRPAVLDARVQAELELLAARRERRIAGRLLTTADADSLGEAMAAVADNSALLRRVLEIHYPRLLRHDTALRSALVGSSGLLGREQVRQFRDGGQPLSMLAAEGRLRLSALQAIWEELPDALREQGQWSPETVVALSQLVALQALTRPSAAVVESSPEQ